jgi:hypothetical protein
MRRSIAAVGACALGLAAFTPGTAQGAPGGGDQGLSPATRVALAAGMPVADKAAPGAQPRGPNPYLALLPDQSKVDYSSWATLLDQKAPARAKSRLSMQRSASRSARALAVSPLLADEDEPAGTRGSNEDPPGAQLVRGFGTVAGQNPKLRVLGDLAPQTVTISTIPATPEDDGSLALAGETGIGKFRDGVRTTAVIGDGPHGKAGTGTNDFDFYKLTAAAGEILTVETVTPSGGTLDSFLQLYGADGTLLAYNDDSGVGFDSKMTYVAPVGGVYYVLVAAYSGTPADVNDPASGDGGASEGPYTVTIAAAEDDHDFYAVKLRKGDVLGASVKGSATYLTVYDTEPREVHGAKGQDYSVVYPMSSPLPGGGNAVTDYVATKAGWHYIGVGDGSGSYDITIEAYRPTLEVEKASQTIFLDFDGARVNTGIFGGKGVVQLSPLSAFLAKWGIPRADEDAVIDAVVARFTENLKQDLIASGLNGRFKLKVLNSRDNPDTFGKANVSRVIIGGTVQESGVDTIGIAQSIDPGNFETQETALLLLDYLSEPAGEQYSINSYLTADSDRIAFVGDVLGNSASHEAGHFFGSWHTDPLNAVFNEMDAGGNFELTFGAGPDGVGGTADDIDIDFGDDAFSIPEGYAGTEDTLGRSVFGLTS